MWWWELLSVALFAMGWWPCGGCVSSPGTNDGCTNCATDTTPDEITAVIGSGAVEVGGNCTDAECDNMAGTYILVHDGSCTYSLSTGTMYTGPLGTSCTTGSPNLLFKFLKWTSGPDSGKYYLEFKLAVSAGFDIEAYAWRKTLTTTKPDCCAETTPSTTLPDYSDEPTGAETNECDLSGCTLTAECT
jgi:hypothetical protein